MGMRKHVIKSCEHFGSVTGSDTVDESRVDIRFVHNQLFVKQCCSEDDRKGNISPFAEDDINMIVLKVSK
jgi:hypothetical protein